MSKKTWLKTHTRNLSGKTVAITGATGGIGVELCRYLVKLGAALVLLDRNMEKSLRLAQLLKEQCPAARVQHIQTDLSDMTSVRRTAVQLQNLPVDIFIHNAGAYSIPRHTCDTGFDNVFQINFVSPYYLIRELLPTLRQREDPRVVVVGSIAHNYSGSDPQDRDFSTRPQASKVYGNAKRYLMFSLYELFETESKVSLAVTHPGITFTNITAHYPKLIFALIKHPMKVIFMKPDTACLSILQGVFDSCSYHTWIGPRFFQIWGLPVKCSLHTCSQSESRQIGAFAEEMYQTLRKDAKRLCSQ